MKNLNAIVWLYRGEIENYTDLLKEYHSVLGEGEFVEILAAQEERMASLREEAKVAVAEASKKEKKKVQAEYDEKIAAQDETLQIAKEAVWLYEKFGDGEYRDISGLCKIADCAEIEGKSWSLTPGAYVGVAPVENDGIDFYERMTEIHEELLKLQNESNQTMAIISQNMKEMGI